MLSPVTSCQQVCVACRLCEVHCVAAHSRSKDVLKAFKRESPRPLARIRVQERGALSFALTCRHCQEPLCVYACLTGAMRRTGSGAVVVDAEKCIGCWTCVLACPFGAVTPDHAAHVAVKCDLCEGQEAPWCVTYCPNAALLAGTTTRADGGCP